MLPSPLRTLCPLLFCLLVIGCASFPHRHAPPSRLKLGALFSPHAVLQRGIPLPIWGTDAPGQRISIDIAGRHADVTAAASGNWTVKFPPLAAGGPYTLAVRGSGLVQVEDIMIGEVWLCSGQSNMWWALHEVEHGDQDAAAANFPTVRLLTVPLVLSPTPLDELTTATWKTCTPAVAHDFSSVGFYFARELSQKLKVPIGMICAAWPGTRIEGWLPPATYVDDQRLHNAMQRFEDDGKDLPAAQKKAKDDFDHWVQTYAHVDPGNAGEAKGWAAPGYDDSRWRTQGEPVIWDFYDMWFDGSVWYRRALDLPADWAGKPLSLHLGRIDDNDITYFNGTRVGASDGDYQSRVYAAPANLVHAGRNTIAIRVFDRFHWGGFMGPEFDILRPADASNPTTATLSLRGPWRFQVEHAFPPVLEPPPGGPIEPWSAQAPARLFNGMVAPLIPYGIRGALWYQGESNANYPPSYNFLLPLLIRSWRAEWGQGDFPFYFVQLAPFEPGPPIASPNWAKIREAQLNTLRLEPNTAMAVLVDHGDRFDIHPRAKEPVGHRLALAALARDYGFPIEFSGPLYDRFELVPGAVKITFTHAGGLHTSGSQTVLGCMIAGGDRRFVPAQGRIEGQTLIVSSPKVATPLAVRYGWANAPALNLFNAAGLPASPFRTDDWANATRDIPPFNPEPGIGELPYYPR